MISFPCIFHILPKNNPCWRWTNRPLAMLLVGPTKTALIIKWLQVPGWFSFLIPWIILSKQKLVYINISIRGKTMFLIPTCMRLKKPLAHCILSSSFPRWFLIPFRQLPSLLALRAMGRKDPFHSSLGVYAPLLNWGKKQIKEHSGCSCCAINVWAYPLRLMLCTLQLPKVSYDHIKHLCHQTADTRPGLSTSHVLAPEVY